MSVFSEFGDLDYSKGGEAVEMIPNRRFCFVRYVSAEAANRAVIHFQSAAADKDMTELLGVKTIMTRFACEALEASASGGAPVPECTSATKDVVVPGCFLINDFISSEEESQLLELFEPESSTWKNTISRRVQHYGFVFNYRSRMLDYSKPTKPLPEECEYLVQRLNETGAIHNLCTLNVGGGNISNNGSSSCSSSSTGELETETARSTAAAAAGQDADNGGVGWALNQLTVNEYLPGQGIASHTDTTSCFGPVIYVVNMGSGIGMTLTKNTATDDEDEKSNASSTSTSKREGGGGGGYEDNDDETAAKIGEAEAAVKKHLFLPARSLLILSGDARYKWSHGISGRRSDQVDGEVIRRSSRRLSLTFRSALLPGELTSDQIRSEEMELDHVVRVYDSIAAHWNHTRGKRKVRLVLLRFVGRYYRQELYRVNWGW